MNNKRLWIALPITLIFLLILGMGGFVIWAMDAHSPQPAAIRALETSDQVKVIEDGGSVHFLPRIGRPQVGFIFYPGGRVAPEAYATLAHEVASEGYLVVIPRMPLNLAVFDRGAARRIMAGVPGVTRWVVGGHSLGGAMAASYAAEERSGVEGLILMASFPAGSNDLSRSGLQVLSIYGTRDGIATPQEVTGAAERLPADTRWVAIEGGNHGGFGDYGAQAGDQRATISRANQQKQIAAAVVEFLESLER